VKFEILRYVCICPRVVRSNLYVLIHRPVKLLIQYHYFHKKTKKTLNIRISYVGRYDAQMNPQLDPPSGDFNTLFIYTQMYIRSRPVSLVWYVYCNVRNSLKNKLLYIVCCFGVCVVFRVCRFVGIVHYDAFSFISKNTSTLEKTIIKGAPLGRGVPKNKT
jgi:hypothetical protein